MDVLYSFLFLIFILLCVYIFINRNETIKRRIFAKIWLSGTNKNMDRMLYRIKKELMARARLEGDLLEVGSADGINNKYYLASSDVVNSLTCIEPNQILIDSMKSANLVTPFTIHHFCGTFSEFVASADKEVNKFNVIILCLLLCSVDGPSDILNECHKLLLPGGRLLVLEHVRDQRSLPIILLQYLMNPLWRILGDNCCLTRQPYLHLRKMEWSSISEEMRRLDKSKLPFIRQFYSCVATK